MKEKITKEKKKEKLVNWVAVKQITNRLAEEEKKEFLANLYNMLLKAGILSLEMVGNYEVVGYFSDQKGEEIKTKDKNKKAIHWGPYPHTGGNLYFTNEKDALDYLKAFYPQCLSYKTMWVKKCSKEK